MSKFGRLWVRWLRHRAAHFCAVSLWKVAHIDAVGLGNRALVDIGESTLRQHFRKLMTPSNMFVVPLKYAGLAELPEFCQAIGTMIKPA